LKAEKGYLESEVIPDWRHKAARVDRRISESTQFTDELEKIRIWLARLRETTSKWFKEAAETEIPSFNITVAEYLLTGNAFEQGNIQEIYSKKCIAPKDILSK
jgi:hypothetical protein